MAHYGVRGVANDWFRSYLSNRFQKVKTLSKLSNPLLIQHGVPQGSVLGPLLFLIYINDLHHAILHSQVYHFADDTSLLYRNKSLKNINQNINHDLKLLSNWLRANKISLNASKTELILFRSKQNKNITKHLNFRLSGQKLKLKSTIKYLGIFLDEHLQWDTHIKYIQPKLSRAVEMLAKIRHYVPFETLLNIHYAIITSYMTYGSQIWGQKSNSLLNKITTLQNKALRIIHFKPPCSPCNNLYFQTKILKFQDHVTFLNCLLALDQQQNTLPTVFNTFFTPAKARHTINTRFSKNKLNIPQVNTNTYGTYSIKYHNLGH